MGDITNTTSTIPTWLTISENEALVKCLQAQQDAGMISGFTFDRQQANILRFRTTGPRTCCFGNTHISNHSVCILQRDGTIAYR